MGEKATDIAARLRKSLKDLGTECQYMKAQIASEALPNTADKAEMVANTMLAYRHLEDARMRLGKVIQAYDGGVSVYDK